MSEMEQDFNQAIILNVDGCITSDRRFYGGIFRLHNDLPVLAFNKKFIGDIGVIEIKDLCEGLRIAEKLGFPSLCTITDSTYAAKVLQKECSSPWICCADLRDATRIMDNMDNSLIMSKVREGNKAADYIASSMDIIEDYVFFPCTFPQPLLNLCTADTNLADPHSGRHRDIFIDGFIPLSTSIAPMFPFFENSSEWDDFGEVINPDDYVSKEEDMDQAFLHGAGDLESKLDEGVANLIFDTKPSKVVSNELTVQVKCSLVYMDFEGRSDGRSIKSILAHVAPLKLVLVHGSAEATEHLKQHCVKHVCPHVYSPQIGENIDVTSDLCAYKVQLSEGLMSNVLFKKLGDYEIAWVDSEVGKMEPDTLSLLPLSTTPPPHNSVLVGDLKLADFKQFLASKGVQVEFSGGALRCGEYVTLRKVGDASQKGGLTGAQQVVLEGPLTEEYYKIREYLYSQYYLV
ncbi:hypothetical protein GIB67_022807 [Kingdonia uniflora]|uniref:Cleavage and polyadenylation specificity factor subunit 2 n=1 Tax=Kingdonia uniflora TaxID=39325 RepID=A0A7J7P6R5_9MAGN|nr:hypothetical protein GIB67_022807 [Kingdonia uniflora]